MNLTLQSVVIKGVFSAVPPTDPALAGRTYYATDTMQILYDTGTGWMDVSPGLVAAAISQIQQQAFTYGVDDGTLNAYAVVLLPAPTLVEGSEVVFKASSTNTGACTLMIGSVIAAIKKQGTVALSGGEINAGQIIRFVYDGTYFQM